MVVGVNEGGAIVSTAARDVSRVYLVTILLLLEIRR